MANASQQSGVIALLEEEDFEAPISESFSAPAANAEQLREMPAQPVPAQNRQPRRQPQEEPGFLDKLFGGESSDQKDLIRRIIRRFILLPAWLPVIR